MIEYENKTQASKDQETRAEIEEFFREYGPASKSAFNSRDYNEISSFITGNVEGSYGEDVIGSIPGHHTKNQIRIKS